MVEDCVKVFACALIRELVHYAPAAGETDLLPCPLSPSLIEGIHGTIKRAYNNINHVQFANDVIRARVVQVRSTTISPDILEFSDDIDAFVLEHVETLSQRSMQIPFQGKMVQVFRMPQQELVEPNLCTDERLEKWALEQHEEAKAKLIQRREHEALVEAKRLETQ
eukprot:gene8175-2827_t